MAAVAGLIFSNTPLIGLYDGFKSIPVVIQAGNFIIDKPLLLWINDGLMAIFFLMVGLEIKRELLEGNLSSFDKAILPAIAALGGLIIPGIIYAFINWDNPIALNGWAIPVVTDIAFALGIIMILSDRIPIALKVCLVAIAIADDLMAVLIIAIFYTAKISTLSLILACAGLYVAAFMNWRGVTSLGPYMITGVFIWACVLKSGVHATLAGVALGTIIPLKCKNEDGKSPLKVMEHALYPWVSFGVIPIFAFANAGVSFAGTTLDTFLNPITLGIILGLYFGKQMGVMLFTWLANILGICRLPNQVTWPQYYGMAVLTGVGFTMSLFIGSLAFTDAAHEASVRIGVLCGSLLSALTGITLLLLTTKKSIKSI